jgi:hypothetical protein
MSAETLLQHLFELGVSVGLTEDVRSLDLDAPKGVLTLELLELIREHKSDLIQLAYEMEEGAAIQWEGESSQPIPVFVGDPLLIEKLKSHPEVIEFLAVGVRLFGACEFEFMPAEAA